MVQYCVVPLCMNTAKRPGISFFSFPKDLNLRKLWIIKIRRDERKSAKVTDAMRVCSTHFVEEDFELSKNGKRRGLRKGSVPSVFQFNSPRKLKKRRILVRLEPEASTAATTAASPVIFPVPAPEHPSPVPDSIEPQQLGPVEEDLIEPPLMSRETLMEKLIAADNRHEELQQRISALSTQLEECMKENGELKNKLQQVENHKCPTFSLDAIKQDPKHIVYYTGFDDVNMLDALLEYINPNYQIEVAVSFSKKLSYQDQMLVVLSKLRQGFDNIDLAYRTCVSPKHISKVFVNWINIIYFRVSYLNIWPHRNVILDNSPRSFKEKYPDTVLLLDCTELYIESPSDLVLQSQSYSSYKSHNTMKGLIGCDPNGGLLFVSSLFTGSISDKKIVEMSGLYKLLEEKLRAQELFSNDSIMFDKGFNIGNEIQSLGLNYNVPPMASEFQFSEQDVLKTRTIASCRVHVERLIRRIKSYKILCNVVPITMMPHLNQVWTICCILTGFRTVTKI